MRRLLLLSLLIVGCDAASGPQVQMTFARARGLYDAPFPSDDLRRADGTIALDKIPNPDNIDLMSQGLALLKNRPGFATSAGIFFQVSSPLDPAKLPDMATTTTADSPVFVVAVDAGAPDLMKRRPLSVAFSTDGGPFGAPNLLSLIPLQGYPLKPGATYAAAITKKLVDLHGNTLGVAQSLSQLIAGAKPTGMSDAAFATYGRALAALTAGGVRLGDLAALTVFTTGTPAAEMGLVRDDMAKLPVPSPGPLIADEVFPDFCVFHGVIDMPDYQAGDSPFATSGGDWQFDSTGKPILQRMTPSNIYVTVPNRPMPAGGWPMMVMVRVGAGGDRALVDRGQCATEDFTAPILPGTGPALYWAKAGFAGVQIDGPLGGRRNLTGDQAAEALQLFNFMNAAALRDNVRETAAELTVVPRIITKLKVDPCPGMGAAGSVTFDASHVGIQGHSNGAWIAPLAVAYEPAYGAMILSGAGGSYIANVMDKQKPLAVRPLAEILLNYNARQRDLAANDPALLLVQWAEEPSDPQVYDDRVVPAPTPSSPPRNVLVLQGIVDHYILPSIANATDLAMGLDLAGPALDAQNAEEQMLKQPFLTTVLPFVGRQQITLPATGNAAGGKATAVVVQHPSDGLEDGHEEAFQTDPPKYQYRCFLSSWAAGVPVVPPDGAVDAPCN